MLAKRSQSAMLNYGYLSYKSNFHISCRKMCTSALEATLPNLKAHLPNRRIKVYVHLALVLSWIVYYENIIHKLLTSQFYKLKTKIRASECRFNHKVIEVCKRLLFDDDSKRLLICIITSFFIHSSQYQITN